ncbi:MAG: hypothetical protein MJK04_13945 [Psychrosphaera sp.]|nr:hypothetical protein [Psychrosphaera sp.]
MVFIEASLFDFDWLVFENDGGCGESFQGFDVDLEANCRYHISQTYALEHPFPQQQTLYLQTLKDDGLTR